MMTSETSKNSPNQALEERLSNMHEQLAGTTSRLDQTERELDLERATREDIIKAEVARQVAEEKAKIRAEIEAEYTEEREHLDRERKALEQREENLEHSFELMEQKVLADARHQIEEARRSFEKSSLVKLAEQFDTFLQLFVSVVNGKRSDAEALLSKYHTAAAEAKEALTKEVQEKLDKAAHKGINKTSHIANLVRMLFTQKRERFIVSEEERGSLYEDLMASLEFTQAEKDQFKKLKEKLDAFRQLKQMERLDRNEKERKGHGRNPIPENIPRLPEILVFPPEYYGHEDEYRIAFPGDTTEFLLPAQTSYYAQPYRRPVIVRKDDVYDHTIVADAVEGPIWKSYASAELLARIEVKKFGVHMPFWRQVKEMEMHGLPISRSTINGWHADVCDIVKPLYNLQEQDVMSDLFLAADGSPMPVVNNEKHRTVKQYIIGYRSITTGIPIFKTTPGEGCGRGKEVIKAQLANWNGLALLCDAYAGYDWIKKLKRILCRCAAHARRCMERALKECPAKAKIGMLMYQEIYAVEEMIRHDDLKGADIIDRRDKLARPIWENFRLWCLSEILEHDEHSLMYKALNYVIRHYDELTAYLDIAEMPLDNNEMERHVRAMVMGKQAYLFCQNEDSCERAAIMYSLIGACKVLGKNPEKWLTYVLKNIGKTKKEDLHKLLPQEWEEQ